MTSRTIIFIHDGFIFLRHLWHSHCHAFVVMLAVHLPECTRGRNSHVQCGGGGHQTGCSPPHAECVLCVYYVSYLLYCFLFLWLRLWGYKPLPCFPNLLIDLCFSLNRHLLSSCLALCGIDDLLSIALCGNLSCNLEISLSQ
jgi:hypothetical protein